MFHPNPITLEVLAKVVPVSDEFSKIHFKDASVLLKYWPERKFALEERKIPIAVMFRENAFQRVRKKRWSLVDQGPAEQYDDERQGSGHPRLAQLIFHGREFTEEFVTELYNKKCGEDDLKTPWRPYAPEESGDQQDRNLYDAFVAREQIQLYARMGTMLHHPDPDFDACKDHPAKDGPYFAGLILRLEYRVPR